MGNNRQKQKQRCRVRYRVPKPDYKLRKGDRMRRTNPWAASSLGWFPVADFDFGLRASYFNGGGGFEVQERIR